MKRLIGPLRVVSRLARRRPVFAGLNVTERCSLACSFCSVWRSPGPEMSLDQLRRVIGTLAALGVQVVGVTGGEPFLRPDLPEIFDLLADQGLRSTLVTNGTVQPPGLIERLKRVRGLLQVAVSVDSLKPEVMKRIRGRDDLATVLATLDRLRRDGPPAVYKINMTLSRLNYTEVDAVLAYARQRGLALTVCPMNLGRGFAHRGAGDGLRPTDDDRRALRQTFLRLARLKREGAPLAELPAFYELAADYVEGLPMRPCDAARLFLEVRADGSLAPCLDQPPFANLANPDSAPRDLAALERLREGVRPALESCSRDTPCCYTCTYNLSTIADHLPAYMLDYALHLVRQRRG